ncbi:MAG: CfrBI family restriction endonuclease [Spirochaetaceae bacterium]|jgi:hypothetical protein|nr:CfrBI family restriction endonuclease [Spirochaetaceae bacterium]
MRLTNKVAKNIITKLIKGLDYRMEVVSIINAEFLQFAIDFFKQVVEAKLCAGSITTDWYKSAFLDGKLSPDEIAINSGLNKKTIHNMYNSSTKEIVINAANQHYEQLYSIIESLCENEAGLDLTLTITLNDVSVKLNISESLIVINTLAVKRAALRGGAWSTAGKQVEKFLLLTLCKLYSVSDNNYDSQFRRDRSKDVDREIDFYLKDNDKKYRCEVKLMGQGNPESADAIFARGTNIFVADKLSNQNKKQAEELKTYWVELHSKDGDGYKRFKNVLEALKIPHSDFNGNIDASLNTIFKDIFH